MSAQPPIAESARYDVAAVGNAIVDAIASADDAFLERHGMTKGAMTLLDEARAQAIYAAMGPAIVSSGGSAANTVAGIASFGGRTAFIGKVRDDDLGRAFRHDITAAGARFTTAPATNGPSTALCLVLVTPDSQRTLNTYLGACVNLVPDDIEPEVIASSSVTYLEGYLYDAPSAQEAFARAAGIAHQAGRLVALSLSDPFCVQRHRDAFAELTNRHVDLLFANEIEIASLLQTGDLDEIVARLRQSVEIGIVTRGERGSLIVTPQTTIEVEAVTVEPVVDTTGAGDLYAAGFLYGYTRGCSLRECGRLASAAAAEAISHFGARPQRELRSLAGV